jgi:hypothetical protein
MCARTVVLLVMLACVWFKGSKWVGMGQTHFLECLVPDWWVGFIPHREYSIEETVWIQMDIVTSPWTSAGAGTTRGFSIAGAGELRRPAMAA